MKAHQAPLPRDLRLAIGVGLVVSLLLASMVFRMPSAHSAPPVQTLLAEALAKTALHEGALANANETLLIWQCAETNAATPAGRLAWLRSHSPRANGVIPAREADGNAWTGAFDFLTVPDGFPEPAYFRSKTLPRSQAIYRLALRLARGEPYTKPCDVPPRSWDGRDFDHTRAARNGLFPIGCVGTSNDGFATKAEIRRVRG